MCDRWLRCRCTRFGGPHTVECLTSPKDVAVACDGGPREHRGLGLGGVAMLMREKAIADPLYLASTFCSRLWQVNLMRTPSSAHREVAQAIVDQANVLYVDARGTAKTTLLDEVGGVYQLLRWPDDTLIYLGSSETNAKALSGQVRAHFIVNEVIRDVFPEYRLPENEAGSILAWSVPCRRVRTKEESVEIGTPDSRLAGRHYDVVFASDIMNENTTPPPCGKGTVELMKSLIQWVAQADGLLKGEDVNLRVHKNLDSNRWHDGDLAGEIIRKDEEDVYRKVIRGVTRAEDLSFIPTWPEVKTSAMLQKIHDSPTMNAATWAANFCSDPLPEGGMSFDRKWFHFYDCAKCSTCGRKHERPARWDDIAITLDPAFSDGKTAKKKTSRSGIVTSGVSDEGHLYVLDTKAGHWSPHGTVEHLFSGIAFWQPAWVGIEETGGSQGLIAIFQSEMQRTGRFVPLRLMKPASRAKDGPDRMGPLHNHAEHFGIFLLESHEELLEELLRFGVAERNDLADAFAQRAMDLYTRGMRTQPEKPRERLDRIPPTGRMRGDDFLKVAERAMPRADALPWERMLSGRN